MNHRLTYCIFIVLLNSCQSNKNVIDELSPIVQKAKETSLYTELIDWHKVNKEYNRLTKEKTTIEGKKAGYQFLINSLQDKHATIRNPKDYSTIVYYTGDIRNPDNRNFDSEFINKIVNSPESKFTYQVIKDKIGLLKIVGIGPGDVKKQSEQIRSGLIALKKKGVNKWIVDLRYNGGGNIDPMISGLAPLIGEGKIGGSVNLKNQPLRELTIKDAQFYNYGRLACEMKNEPAISQNEKIVVLLSRYTVSSGEMLAISFKGRPNTKFIGEDSGGLTTGNGFDLIDDEVYLVISQGIFSDRNDVAYKERVNVDEYIEFDHYAALETDEQVKQAIEWLNE